MGNERDPVRPGARSTVRRPAAPSPRPPSPPAARPWWQSIAQMGRSTAPRTVTNHGSDPLYGSADTLERQSNIAYANAQAAMPAQYVDPFNGLSPMDAYLMGNDITSSNGGGGGSAGGSGGSAAADAAELERLKLAYAQMGSALDYQNAATDTSFADRGKSLTDLQSQGDARLQALMAQLASSRDGARTSAAGSFANTGNALAQLAAQYGEQAANRDAGANRSLQAFGAQPVVGGSGNAAQDYLMGAQVQNTQLGGAADAAYVNRSNVYNGLNSDTSMQYNNMYTQLQAQLAAARQQEAIAAAQRKAQLAIEAAKNGVQL